MSASIETTVYPNASDGGFAVVTRFDQSAMLCEVPNAIFQEVVRIAAERYVDEHYAEIVAKLDQNAIANLAVADAGKKIAEEIRSRPEIITQTKSEIYQRGVFGGIRRLR